MTCTWVGLSCAPSNFKLHCDVGPKKDFGWDVFVYSQFQVRTRYIQYFSERVGRSTLPFREGDLLPVWNSNSPQSSANWLAPTWVPHLHWLNADVIWLGICFFLLWPHYWKCAAICWRCNAARIPRPGFRKKTSPSLINTLLDTWDLLCYKLLVISIAHKLNYHPIPPPYLKHLGLLSGPNLVEIPTKPSNHPSVYNHIWWWDQFHEMGECLVYIISAVPLARFGPLFTDFNMVWQLRTTSEWIRDCLPHPPNPLIYVQGFDVSMLTLCWH